EPVVIPGLGQLPTLLQRDHGAASLAPLLAPAVNVLLRPEQKDGPSSENQVLIPLAHRYLKMNDASARCQLAALYAQCHVLVTARTGSDDSAVLVQSGENSHAVPDAVCPPALFPGPDFEGRGHGAERSHAPEVASLSISDDHRVAFAQPKQGVFHFGQGKLKA